MPFFIRLTSAETGEPTLVDVDLIVAVHPRPPAAGVSTWRSDDRTWILVRSPHQVPSDVPLTAPAPTYQDTRTIYVRDTPAEVAAALGNYTVASTPGSRS